MKDHMTAHPCRTTHRDAELFRIDRDGEEIGYAYRHAGGTRWELHATYVRTLVADAASLTEAMLLLAGHAVRPHAEATQS